VCGYAPRQRLDVVVNIFTNQAYHNGKIKVMGGSQKRPNIHISDMVGVYMHLLNQPDEAIDGKIWNAGDTNYPIVELAEIVREVVGSHVEIEVVPTDDLRSYHVSGKSIRDDIGFDLQYGIKDAVSGLVAALEDGRLPNSLDDPKYFNISLMKNIKLA
jgi:nucleoside-diphosphate-sugar epimerase